jgi:hypothetical protein
MLSLGLCLSDCAFCRFCSLYRRGVYSQHELGILSEDIFGSGYSRYAKPISNAVFGNYELVERCAATRWSPLEASYRKIDRFDEETIEGFYRAATSFAAAYLEATKGQVHSYAFARLLGSFEGMTSPISTVESMREGWHRSPAYAGLSHAIQFIAFVVEKMDKLDIPPASLRERTNLPLDPYDGLAELFYNAVFQKLSTRYNLRSGVSSMTRFAKWIVFQTLSEPAFLAFASTSWAFS